MATPAIPGAPVAPKLPQSVTRAFPLPSPDTPGAALKSHLPPPPARGSAVEKAELSALKALEAARTPEGNRWAERMDQVGATREWLPFLERMRERKGAVPGWAGTALAASTMAANAVVTSYEKLRFNRARPFEVDPTLTTVGRRPRSDSYPSGHTSSAFAAARVISELDPSQAAAAYKLAHEVGYSRMYAGVHFPTDVIAGASIGTAVADKVLKAMPGR